MDLFLRAFGQSNQYSLKERANLIINLHQKVSDLLGNYEWKLLGRKKTVEIDIRNKEASYPFILQQVKSGMNAKVAKPIRYKEDDIPDITSSCNFYNKSFQDYHFYYTIGFPSYHGFPGLAVGIDKINDSSMFTKEKLRALTLIIIKEWKPETLCVTDSTFFFDISKASKNNTPWSGWFTYLSNDLLKVKEIIKRGKIDKIGLSSLEPVGNQGTIFWTCNEEFDVKNEQHVKTALNLENFFKRNEIFY